MGSLSNRPDLVISIDFGMTCTGVAYCNVAAGNDIVRHIQRWPGRTQANENKVPTLLIYPHNSSTPSSWGFLAETAQEQSGTGYDSREWFKIMLDEDLLEGVRQNATDPGKVPRIHEVEKWYTDYFSLLYRTIEARLKGEIANHWDQANIEFIFSVPTTWRPPTVERFKNIISRAGFESSPRHTSIIGLTEAEAAAVHTARNTPAIFSENDILLVCDIGGGTTDLSVFRVSNTNAYAGSLTLAQIDVVFGSTIGAAQLDNLFEASVLARLQHADRVLPLGLPDLHQAAWEMRISKEYQNAKCDYGSEESFADTETFVVAVPHLSREYVNEKCGISGGDMQFRRDELKGYFDEQLTKLYQMIDKQIVRLQQKIPNDQVGHLVLSGGLGNSAYVRDSVRNRFAFGNSNHGNARNIQIRVAPDPQLVVCKGNVADRIQKLKSGQSVLGWRCCRASYGTLCKVAYDPQNRAHIGLKTEIDAYDGKLYVMDYIDWLIKKGEPVSIDQPKVASFNRKCQPATSYVPHPPRVFPTAIICSEVDREFLPPTMNSSCRSICKVESDFSSVPLSLFKLKNRHWWNTGKKYHRINYNVKVLIGAADISFELWHEGVKVSKDNSIKVEWQASPPPDPALSSMATDFPMNLLPSVAEKNRLSKQNGRNGGGWGPSAPELTAFNAAGNAWANGKTGASGNIIPVTGQRNSAW